MQVCWCGFSITNFMKYAIFPKVLWIKTYQIASGESSEASRIHYMMKVLAVTDPVRKHSAKRWFSLKLLSFFSPKQLTSESKLMRLEKHRCSKDERRIGKPGTENNYCTKWGCTYTINPSLPWSQNVKKSQKSILLKSMANANSGYF